MNDIEKCSFNLDFASFVIHSNNVQNSDWTNHIYIVDCARVENDINIWWSIHNERKMNFYKKIEECCLFKKVKEWDIWTDVGCDWIYWIYSFDSTEDFTDNLEWWISQIVSIIVIIDEFRIIHWFSYDSS
jgi:hypothetical protein